MGGKADMEWAIRTRNGSCRRRNLRIDVMPPIQVVLRSEDGEFPGELHDISLGGARISSASFPPGAESFNVSHDQTEEIRADVRWCEGNVMGVAFERGPPAVGLLTQCLRRLVPLDRARV